MHLLSDSNIDNLKCIILISFAYRYAKFVILRDLDVTNFHRILNDVSFISIAIVISDNKINLPSIYPCMRFISWSIDSGGSSGKSFPHVQGGEGGGGRSKSRDGPLILAESIWLPLPADEGRCPPPLLVSLAACLPLFLAEI